MLKTELDKRLTHVSFHTPGHNGGVSVSEDVRDVGTGFDTRYDVTELSYTDNLLESNGVLKDLERRTATAFGAENALLFTNGATGAVFAAVAAIRGKFAVVGKAHVSVYRALSLFRKHAVYCEDFAALSEYLSDAESGKAEKVSAIFVTSPDYLGNIEDLAAFRDAANGAGALLVIDSSHGSHFAFCKKFPIRASEYGDLVIYSLHKTLPVLTGGAAIAVRDAYADAAFDARRMTHTTSPSYPVLLSIESALEKLRHGEEDYEEVFSALARFRKSLEGTEFRVVENDDPTRLVIESEESGGVIAAALEERGIYAEYADGNAVIFIVTPYNRQYLSFLAETLKSLCSFLGRGEGASEKTGNPEKQSFWEENSLVEASKTIAARGNEGEGKLCSETSERCFACLNGAGKSAVAETLKPSSSGFEERMEVGFEKPLKRRELVPFSDESEVVPLEDSEGRRLNVPIGLYPPGVPTFFAGDVIDRNTIAFIKKNRSRMFGLARKGVSVVK